MIGARLGPYEITAQLGAGGMSEVFGAKDMKLGRDVAIKVLPSAFAAERQDAGRTATRSSSSALLGEAGTARLHLSGALSMDVARVLDLVRPFFESRGEPYALVGGLALLAHGAPRATFDVDLLAPRGIRDALVAFLEQNRFTTLSVQPGFSNHQHSDPALGRVDVIYVSGATAEAVFAGCSRKTIAGAALAPIPRPEHLVAMKVQAFAKDQSRYSDLADLQFLLSMPELDLAEARSYFESAGLGEYFEKLRRR